MVAKSWKRIDFSRASVSVSQRTNKPITCNNGKPFYPWRARLVYWEEVGRNEDGTPIYKRREKNHSLPKTVATENGALQAANKWVSELKKKQAGYDGVAEKLRREKAAAEEAERQRKAEEERRAHEVTVCGQIDAYITELFEGGTIEASTYTDYKKCAERVRKTLGDMPITELTTQRIDAWDEAMAKRYAVNTAKKTRVVLRASMADARDKGLIDVNPVRERRKSKRERIAEKNDTTTQKHNYLDRESRTRLVRGLDTMADGPVTMAARIALYCGLRRGECCGLVWQDVDLAGGFISVRRAIGTGEGGQYVKMPKSDEVRDVPMPPELTRALKRWRRECASLALQAGCDIERCWVIGNPSIQAAPECLALNAHGKPEGNMHPTTLSREWEALAKWTGVYGALGKTPTFHNLRHTFAYVMANEMQMPIRDLAEILGHGNTKTTEQYYIAENREAKRRHLAQAMKEAYENGTMSDAPARVAKLDRTGTD